MDEDAGDDDDDDDSDNNVIKRNKRPLVGTSHICLLEKDAT